MKDKKIIDLGILEDDEATGVKKISLVEDAAIMVDFMYFNRQEFVQPSAGESENEFISRCMSDLAGEFPEEGQRAAVCYSYWEGEVDTSGLTPYVDPGDKKKDLIIDPQDFEAMSDFEREVIKRAIECGVDFEECELQKFASAQTVAEADSIRQNIDTDTRRLQDGEWEIRYKYAKNPNIAGGGAERGFCKAMMYIGRLYTREEIDSMSQNGVNSEFAEKGNSRYDIFLYRGGSYCKHMFQAYLYYKPSDGSKQIVNRAPAFDGPTAPVARLNFSTLRFESDEKMVVVGPAMIPDINIPRIDEDGDTYYVKFTEETIREIAMKYMKEARTVEINTDHEDNEAGAYVFESWIIEDPETDKANTKYSYNLPKGTWMISLKVEDKGTWRRIKNGELKGFSVEGILVDMEEIEARKKYEQIKKILR